MITLKIDEKKLIGAIAVLENYIDGALSDYERDMIEDNQCLEDSIYVHKILELASTHGFSALEPHEYTERYNAKKGK